MPNLDLPFFCAFVMSVCACMCVRACVWGEEVGGGGVNALAAVSFNVLQQVWFSILGMNSNYLYTRPQGLNPGHPCRRQELEFIPFTDTCARLMV